MEEQSKDKIPPVTAAMIHFVCKREVSFATLARSSTSRCAIAATSRIDPGARINVLMQSAKALGFEGLVRV